MADSRSQLDIFPKRTSYNTLCIVTGIQTHYGLDGRRNAAEPPQLLLLRDLGARGPRALGFRLIVNAGISRLVRWSPSDVIVVGWGLEYPLLCASSSSSARVLARASDPLPVSLPSLVPSP